MPELSQYYFRTIRFDSEEKTDIHFILYERTIEINIMTLHMEKERINDSIKTKQFVKEQEVLGDFNLQEDFLDMLIEKVYDKETKTVRLNSGKQLMVA